MSSPIFLWQIIYQPRALPVPAQEDIPKYGWARQPLSEPVRTIQAKFLNTASQAAFFWSESQQFPETVTESRWHQAWSEPVRIRPWLTTATNADNHYLELNPLPIIQVPSWFNALSDPVRTRWFAAAQQQFQPYNETQQFPETVTESRWHQPWSEPSVKAKPWLTAAQQHFLEFDAVPFVKIDWFNGLSEPVRVRWFAASQQQFQPYDETQQFPETVTEDRWHQSWSEPVRVKPNIGEGRQQSLALPETSPLQVWYPPPVWPDTVPGKPRAALFQPDASVPFVPPAAQVWYPPNYFDDFAARRPPTPQLITDPSAFVQTVSQPAAPDLPTMSVGECGPVFTQTIIYQQSAFVQLATAAVQQVWYPVDRWPDFAAKIKPSAEYQASTFLALPPTATVVDDWPDFAAKVTLAAAQQQSFAFGPVPITSSVPSVDGWVTQLSTPVRAKPTVTWQQYLAQTEAAPFTETVSEDKWHQPWSESPVKAKPGLAAALQQSLAFDPASFPNTAATVDGWGSQLSEPIVKGKIGLAAAQQQALAEVLVPSLVTPFLSLAWHIQLAEPVRQRPALGAGLNPDQAEVINPANVTPFIGLGWYLPLSDNGRRAPQYSAMLPIDANFNPNPIPNPPVFGVFAVSGGDVNDRFPVNGLSYTYSPMSHRTN